MSFDLNTTILTAILLAALIVGYKWYLRYSERAARRVYASYHVWVRNGGTR